MDKIKNKPENDFGFLTFVKTNCQLMGHTYKLTVNDGKVFEVSEEALSGFDAVSIEKDKFHILNNDQSYKATITNSDFLSKKYTVQVNGNTYQVAIANALDQLISDMGFAVGIAKQVNEIKAPMPGSILEISVVVGQEVQENDPLVILEAMKMENSFLSPRAGIIKLIAVTKGQAVEKGQLLIEFEPS